MRKKGYLAYHRDSLPGMWYALRASLFFQTSGNGDTNAFLIGGAKEIMLWHGMGMKHVARFRKEKTQIPKYAYGKWAYSHKRDIWFAACEEAVKKYSESYHIDRSRFHITGQPKDDTFINNTSNAYISAIRQKHPGCKIAVYMPTHRKYGKKQTNTEFMGEAALRHVNDLLRAQNMVLIFKPHFHEFKNYSKDIQELSHIIFATDVQVFGDAYEFLPACDALITDYSGIAFGYLTSGKPIIYFPYDMETYLEDDFGLYYPYEEIAAGPICYTWEAVVAGLEEAFGEDSFASRREALRLRFSPFNDGKNCERAYQKAKELAGLKV